MNRHTPMRYPAVGKYLIYRDPSAPQETPWIAAFGTITYVDVPLRPVPTASILGGAGFHHATWADALAAARFDWRFRTRIARRDQHQEATCA